MKLAIIGSEIFDIKGERCHLAISVVGDEKGLYVGGGGLVVTGEINLTEMVTAVAVVTLRCHHEGAGGIGNIIID